MRFRQVHLDFHTSPAIPGIGKEFDKKEWQQTLEGAHVNSITCFSCCHHGYSYHPTNVGQMHPELDFNLLRAQIDACHEIDIKVPVYVSAGFNEMIWQKHPEWRECWLDGTPGAKPFEPFFRKLCFNTSYLDWFCELLKETVTLFPDADGIFTDIIYQGECCCPKCMRDMLAQGYDPEKPLDRRRFAFQVLRKYYARSVETVHSIDPDMPIFHNSGHISRSDSEVLDFFSHLELESLPTGGWGYDHYPLSAAYCRNLGKEFLGMTGKFHTTWGEFGGFKHPNALRYECAAMIANGSKCSIGDQLHPCGKLDESTYKSIGIAYKEVEEKEKWCDNVRSLANIAIIGSEATVENPADSPWVEKNGDVGASRILQEMHLPFEYIRPDMDMSGFKMVILPDNVRLNKTNAARINDYIARGGKVVLSGTSGMELETDEFVVDIGAEYCGRNDFFPGYIKGDEQFMPEFLSTPFVVYSKSCKIKPAAGVRSIGQVYDPYFQRSYKAFCSHQHTPYRTEASEFSAGVMTENVLYFAHNVFTAYCGHGNVPMREFIANTIYEFLGRDRQIICNMPSQGRVTYMEQAAENRRIVHLLYANTIYRGSRTEHDGAQYGWPVEVVDDLNPCPEVKLEVKCCKEVKKVILEPEGRELAFEQTDGMLSVSVPSFVCHQMVVLEY